MTLDNSPEPRRKPRHRRPPPAERPDVDWSYYTELVRDSKAVLPSLPSRELLAESAVTLLAQIRSLRGLMVSDRLTSDEQKALSAACSNLRRVLETLGVAKQSVPEPSF